MKKITVKIPAKINLTLDVIGKTENYHDISSLVCSIDIVDEITVVKRKDDKITLKMTGLPVNCPITDNNAYKAAALFQNTFKTGGVDIVVNKNIPVGGGLGGSSADIAGVLKALNLLFETDMNMVELAADLGSDAPYMINGGYAVISGRGEKIERHNSQKTLYFLLITENAEISARACYKKFDQKKKEYPPCTAKAVTCLENEDEQGLLAAIKNDLTAAACEILPDIKFNLHALKKAGASAVTVAGSGPTVAAVFLEKKQRDAVYKKLKSLFDNSIIKAQTIVPNK